MEHPNKHHVLFPRALWTASVETRKLRQVKELIPVIGIVAHRGLHREVEIVPTPDYHMVNRIVREFYPVRNDTLGTIDNLIQAVGMSFEEPRCSNIAKGLGSVLMASLEAQKLHIQAGFEEME